MVKFIDGPAAEKTLNLARSPNYLRVVISSEGVVDALDQPGDAPRAGEKVFAYILKKDLGGAFIDGRDKKTGKRYGYFTKIAEYSMVDNQPTNDELAVAERWQSWVNKQAL